MLRTLVIAAHPDEPEIYAGGTAALLAGAGHAVKFLTLTNGSAGHHTLSPERIAVRRAAEAHRAADALGVVDYEIFDIGDGRLEADVATRIRVLRAIRSWRPDLVIALHGDGSGHPDNRAAGRLAENAVEFVTVPNYVPDSPAMERQPVCLLMADYAAGPRHRAHLVVDVDPVIEAKLDACLAHASQFLEFAPWQRGLLDRVPAPGDVEAGRAFVLEHWAEFLDVRDRDRPALTARYGVDHADKVRYAEPFEFAPYGRRAEESELQTLLPFTRAGL